MSDSDNNCFELSVKRGGGSPKRPRYPNVWTPDEQTEKLTNYIEISSKFWTTIKYGTHIRYININGDFNHGGFVLKNPINYTSSETSTKLTGIRLQNGFNNKDKNYLSWIVAYENISKLFIKVDASIKTVIQSLELTINNVNSNIKKITDYVKYLDERIKKLENK
jgi:hypothetical protein